MKKKGDVDGLIVVLKAEEPLVGFGAGAKSSAAFALGEIGDVRAVEPLVQVLKDWNRMNRWFAAQALEKLGWKPRNEGEKASYFIAKQWYGRVIWRRTERLRVLQPIIHKYQHPAVCWRDDSMCRNRNEFTIQSCLTTFSRV